MAWNQKYWDILEQLYWTPKYLGLGSISRKLWQRSEDTICIPADCVNASGPLYRRTRQSEAWKAYLESQEETLNHVFDLTFAIAEDEVLQRLFCEPLEFRDSGPFETIGREVRERYSWGSRGNVTQQDGFFATPKSLVGVELKTGSPTSALQIAKYAALILWEEALTGRRAQVGLLYIVPEAAVQKIWKDCGLDGPAIDGRFLESLKGAKLPKQIERLISDHSDDYGALFDRMKLGVISWQQFRDDIFSIESSLREDRPGQQTLRKLLHGMRRQIESHGNALTRH